MLEKRRNKMTVMSKKVNWGFEVAPEKREDFLEGASSSRSFARTMERARKNILGFDKKEIKRKQ